ncbi:unnamed protein product [Ambrosiozyma monospora]|uniref:Unnamed protein product n=1 Tax=Ambrosiozyma monospora TaxID=43982 RepID=A0ACB5T0J4_AMBMO|nr:unnamed protein product [Ambrosiozyma monospora]
MPISTTGGMSLYPINSNDILSRTLVCDAAENFIQDLSTKFGLIGEDEFDPISFEIAEKVSTDLDSRSYFKVDAFPGMDGSEEDQEKMMLELSKHDNGTIKFTKPKTTGV